MRSWVSTYNLGKHSSARSSQALSKALYVTSFYPSQQSWKGDSIIIPTLQMMKLRLREVVSLTENHTAGRQ